MTGLVWDGRPVEEPRLWEQDSEIGREYWEASKEAYFHPESKRRVVEQALAHLRDYPHNLEKLKAL